MLSLLNYLTGVVLWSSGVDGNWCNGPNGLNSWFHINNPFYGNLLLEFLDLLTRLFLGIYIYNPSIQNLLTWSWIEFIKKTLVSDLWYVGKFVSNNFINEFIDE